MRPSRTAAAMVAKLSSASTISAASLAASVPLWPMATPTLARLSAGASLTPSPVIDTTAPSACNASTSLSLCSGLVRAKTDVVGSERRSAASSIASIAWPVSASTAPLPKPSSRAIAAPVEA